MALAIGFSPKTMTATQYEECLRRLDAAGFGSPDGRREHLCYGTPDELRVVDVWESQEAAEAFGEHLRPVLEEVGITDPPQMYEAHAFVSG